METRLEPVGEPDPPQSTEEVVEKVSRPRVGARIENKLDRILEAVTGGSKESSDDGSQPEVTFEPEPEQLPRTPESNDPADGGDPDSASGDDRPGNPADTPAFTAAARRRRGFPGRKRSNPVLTTDG